MSEFIEKTKFKKCPTMYVQYAMKLIKLFK